MAGRGALVTGSTGSIGLAIAECLAASGCAVTFHGLAPAEQGAVHEMLINKAVTRHLVPIAAMTPNEWEAERGANPSAPSHATRLRQSGMRAHGWGPILDISSVHGLSASAGRLGQVIAKPARIRRTRAVAKGRIRDGATCTALRPGSTPKLAIETHIAAGMAARGETDCEAAMRDVLAGKQPIRRFVRPEAVATMVVFLRSPAGGGVTEAALPIAGGWSAG